MLAWIEKIIDDFDSNEIPTQQVANFTLKIVCMLCKNEWTFMTIKEKGFLDKIHRGIENKSELQTASTKLCHLKLLRAVSRHLLGLHWLKQIKCWNLFIKYFQTNATIYIIREIGHIFYEVLIKFSELMKDDSTVKEALEVLMDPILKYKGLDVNDASCTQKIVDNDEFSNEVIPVINIVNQILWQCVESKKRSRIAYYILLVNQYENKLWIIQDCIENDMAFLTVICRAHIISNFTRLSSMDIPSNDLNPKAKDLSMDEHAVHFYNLCRFTCMRRIYKCINMIMECHHQLWSLLSEEVTKENVLINHDLKFGDQVIMIQAYPIIHAINTLYKSSDGYIADIFTKMFNMSCQHTIKVIYELRDLLAHESFEHAIRIATNAVHSYVAVKKCIKRDRAILAFQILIYILRSYIEDPSTTCGRTKLIVGNPQCA